MTPMFAPPPVLKTRVFTRLPDHFRKPEATSEWHRHQPGALAAHSLLEGPAFDAAGNLYCVDIPWGRIFRIDPKGEFTLIAEYDGEPNGLKVMPNGSLLIADYKNGLVACDPATGTITPVLARVRLERLKALNDLTLGRDGTVFFTDQGLTGLHDPTGRVFRMRPDGMVDCLIDNVPSPNGLVLSPDESVLYVAVTRANAIWRVPLMRDGTVAKVGLFIQLSGGGGPDGIAMDGQGRLAVAHIGLGVVWLFSARGEPLYRIESCTGAHTTNIVFSPDGKTLTITESETGTILIADIPD
jgi:gluconolactonase